ncbi:MAG: Holliday junction branch migration protein RuvA [Oscillospiraceae bacterium]|jgi:Holliday junction DNA helicase RuvA|nr:Holliday junction branch migration protein RuvA [Oscillospiraceae bacterium]
MYAFIEGSVAEKRQGELVIDAGGVGYLLICPAGTVAAAPATGERFRCYTHLSVREDAMELFGFASREERGMFLKLCGVTGVGPRTALGVLSALPLRDLTLALALGDLNALARAPGIGKKTAQRLVLELKDKVEAGEVTVGQSAAPVAMGAQQEAVQALVSLGYSSAEAARAINQVREQADKTDQLIMLALKQLDIGP